MYTYSIKKLNMLLIRPILIILVKFKELSDTLDNFLTKNVHGVFVLIRKHFNRNYPKIKKITSKIVIGTVIIDSLLFFYLYDKIFSPITLVESSSIKSYYEPLLGKKDFSIHKQTEISIQTKELLNMLKQEGLIPKVVSTNKNSKPEFTVYGNIITINNDNISVFEYINPQIAERDAILYANKYNKDKQQYMSESTHIYLKDNIVIFYLGTRENIIQPLTLFTENSLIK